MLILKEMESVNINEPLLLFQNQCNYQEIYQELFNKSIEANLKKVPARVFKVPFYYFKHRGTVVIEENGIQVHKLNICYYYDLTSEYILWRFPLNFIRYFSFTNNTCIYAYQCLFNHYLGFSSFWEDRIYSNPTCDPTTGEIKLGEGKSTLKSNLSKLCNSISKDRKDFEESPDDSFFGKNCARVFNLFYNYVLKTVTALFVFLIGFPLLILFWSLFWGIVIITCYVWGLFGIIFYSLLCLLIVDLDHPSNEEIGLGLIPIIFYTLLTKFFFQLIGTIFLLFGQPIAAIFLFFIGLLRMIFRFCYDCFMFIIVWIFAKVPVSDSFLAWKISGPGLSRQYYNHIEIGDALTLVHAELEKCELLTFKTLLYTILEYPLTKANDFYKKYNNLDLKFDPNPLLSSSIAHYKRKLNEKIYERLSLFPSVSNIKFNEEELTTLKISSRDYIREYVTSHRMEYLFDHFKLQKNSWGKLSELILQSAFGLQILESLTDLDFKIEIKREENINFDQLQIKIVEKSGIKALNNSENLKNRLMNMELTNVKLSDITNKDSNRLLYLNVELLV